jgi:hypothetical protein
MRGGEKGKNNSVNFKKSKNKKFEILIIGLFNLLDIYLRFLEVG